jgi:hypothetical protein
MYFETSTPVAAESYPTFWDDAPPAAAAPAVAPDEAYTAFVNLAEDHLPAHAPADQD